MKFLQSVVAIALIWAGALLLFGLIARITWEMLRLGWSVL